MNKTVLAAGAIFFLFVVAIAGFLHLVHDAYCRWFEAMRAKEMTFINKRMNNDL